MVSTTCSPTIYQVVQEKGLQEGEAGASEEATGPNEETAGATASAGEEGTSANAANASAFKEDPPKEGGQVRGGLVAVLRLRPELRQQGAARRPHRRRARHVRGQYRLKPFQPPKFICRTLYKCLAYIHMFFIREDIQRFTFVFREIASSSFAFLSFFVQSAKSASIMP